MKHHGKLFKAEMVRAQQEGRKTMTRRNITFENSTTDPRIRRDEWKELRWAEAQRGEIITEDLKHMIPFWFVPFRDTLVRVYPRIQPGDLIWVKETWADVNTEEGPAILYRADGAYQSWHDFSKVFGPDEGAGPSMNYDAYPGNYTMWWTDLLNGEPDHCWRSSMLMPRWASRTDLDVIRVGSQRIQDISESDCISEGIADEHCTSYGARYLFGQLWNRINEAKGFGWEANHPVWIYEWPAVTK
jgi:hypothetical protein